jgi:hypothetical protein
MFASRTTVIRGLPRPSSIIRRVGPAAAESCPERSARAFSRWPRHSRHVVLVIEVSILEPYAPARRFATDRSSASKSPSVLPEQPQPGLMQSHKTWSNQKYPSRTRTKLRPSQPRDMCIDWTSLPPRREGSIRGTLPRPISMAVPEMAQPDGGSGRTRDAPARQLLVTQAPLMAAHHPGVE